MRIRAINISAGYGRDDILHSVSFELATAEVVGLIGPNGCGKTTLLRALSRSLALRSGTLEYDDEPASSLSAREVARRIAFVPQTEPRLFEFTVRDVVLMGRNIHLKRGSAESEQDFAAAAQAIESMGLMDLADRSITELSGGEHRRALIARAFAQSSPALFLDEPTAHLDITHQSEVLAICRRLVEQESMSVLAALHDLNLAAEFCDRLVLLSAGRILCEGSPREVLTEDKIFAAYGAEVRLLRHPATEGPLVWFNGTRNSEEPLRVTGSGR